MRRIKHYAKQVFLLCLSLSVLWSCQQDTTEYDMKENEKSIAQELSIIDYYWGSDGKIPITKSSDKAYVLFRADNTSKLQKSSQTTNIGTFRQIEEFEYKGDVTDKSGINFKTLSLENLKTATANVKDIAELIKADEVVYTAPYYRMENGKEYPLTNRFYVELKNLNDIHLLEELAVKHNVIIVGKILLTDDAYTLLCTKSSSGNALEMANLFYETNLFKSSAPEFQAFEVESINDPLFPMQWNMSNTGQRGITGVDIGLYNARILATGSNNITIAIIDHGVAAGHPDLRVTTHYDAATQTNTARIYNNSHHGTSCAGIIAAQTNNGIGVAGVAPGCKLMSISTTFATDEVVHAILYAAINGADVISNSWGSSVDMPTVNSAIKYALTSGRNGKGCVVVFSAGNDDQPQVNYPKAAHPDLIVVGAINPEGKRIARGEWNSTQGSNYGTALDIMAPGIHIVTTDGASSYRYDFGGTSSACPHVSGVAGLLLSINPNLTQKEVGTIIEKTASKVGKQSYNTLNTARTNGTWYNEMGYGLVNPYAALSSILGNSGVQITGPTGWVSGKSNISLTLNGSYSGARITWKCPSPDFRIISGQGTANLVCKFSSTQNPVVTAEIELSSSPGIVITTEGRIQLKVVHFLHKPGLIDLYYDGADYDGTECFLIVIKNSIYHDSSIPVDFEIQVNNGTLHHNPGNIYAYFYFKDPGEYIISCRAKFRDIYSDWIEETIYKEAPDPYYR